jgi:hypothetical protein
MKGERGGGDCVKFQNKLLRTEFEFKACSGAFTLHKNPGMNNRLDIWVIQEVVLFLSGMG